MLVVVLASASGQVRFERHRIKERITTTPENNVFWYWLDVSMLAIDFKTATEFCLPQLAMSNLNNAR